MAKRGRTKYVTRYVKTKARSRATRGFAMGKMKPLITGAAGQIAGNFLSGMLGGLGSPAGKAVVGYIGNNSALMTIAGMELGNMFAGGTVTNGGGVR